MPPKPSKLPQRFSETFANRPAPSPRGLVPGRRVWISLGWAGAVAAVCALGIPLAGSGVLASDDGTEVAAANGITAASPTPSPTPSLKSASPSRTPEKTAKETGKPDTAQAQNNPGTVATVTATASARPPAAEKTSAAGSKATPEPTTPTQDFSRPVGQISGHYDGFIGKCVQLVGNSLQLYGCDGGSDQQWRFAANGTLQKGGRCLSLAGRATSDGTGVVMAACDSTKVTQWRVSGAYDIVNVAADKCLDVANASTADGAPLQIAWCSGNAAQKWTVP
ncbi:RICIN domain-containing protein [Streptomyces canus]|uniref:RICIN domain-containing protein n=1 Tax=Streptomyces canus TaxID=58343 RepID=UPI002DDB27CA|nr:RICIN domain-containing protein [Streptomyces canus]WSD83161.1 RICIN domain-containing protein [Streptomyces canus]